MSTTRLSVNPQKITVSGTSENELDFSKQNKIVLQIEPGFTIKYKGGAGSEVFTVSIVE